MQNPSVQQIHQDVQTFFRNNGVTQQQKNRLESMVITRNNQGNYIPGPFYDRRRRMLQNIRNQNNNVNTGTYTMFGEERPNP